MSELEHRVLAAIKAGTIKHVDDVPMNWKGALQTLTKSGAIATKESELVLCQ